MSTSDLRDKIVQAVGASIQVPTSSGARFDPLVNKGVEFFWRDLRTRGCLESLTNALLSGRYCDKLVVVLQFQKSGRTSIIEYLHALGMRSDLRVNYDLSRFPDHIYWRGTDVEASPKFENLRIHSQSNLKKMASRPSFWRSLHDRGLDFVSLEYNFMIPQQFFSIKTTIWGVISMSRPWDRFLSTYERELWRGCLNNKSVDDTKNCIEEYSLERWMANGTGEPTKEREQFWKRYFSPNYYVKMLNGVVDQDDFSPTRHHDHAPLY